LGSDQRQIRRGREREKCWRREVWVVIREIGREAEIWFRKEGRIV